MFEPDLVLIGQVVDKLETDFRAAYGPEHDEVAAAIAPIARPLLEKIATCNALYHNVFHTILVTLVGNDILKGRLAIGDELLANAWLDFLVSLLCHDIGYAPDLCQADRDGVFACGKDGETFSLPIAATHASLAPHHVDRSMLYVAETFADHPLLDAQAIMANIERTRFPVPADAAHQVIDDTPGLLRAADLLGQVGEPRVARRYPALFYEFEETGVNRKLGFASPQDLIDDFPQFYAKVVVRYCAAAMRLLEATADGQMWLSNLHYHLAATEDVENASRRS